MGFFNPLYFYLNDISPHDNIKPRGLLNKFGYSCYLNAIIQSLGALPSFFCMLQKDSDLQQVIHYINGEGKPKSIIYIQGLLKRLRLLTGNLKDSYYQEDAAEALRHILDSFSYLDSSLFRRRYQTTRTCLQCKTTLTQSFQEENLIPVYMQSQSQYYRVIHERQDPLFLSNSPCYFCSLLKYETATDRFLRRFLGGNILNDFFMTSRNAWLLEFSKELLIKRKIPTIKAKLEREAVSCERIDVEELIRDEMGELYSMLPLVYTNHRRSTVLKMPSKIYVIQNVIPHDFEMFQEIKKNPSLGIPILDTIEQRTVDGNVVTYALKAIVYHIGLRLDNGHYITVRKRDNCRMLRRIITSHMEAETNHWYVCDDERVFSIAAAKIRESSHFPYLLFYEMISKM